MAEKVELDIALAVEIHIDDPHLVSMITEYQGFTRILIFCH